MKRLRTGVDQVSTVILQCFYRLSPRAAYLLDHKLDVLGVNTSLINGSLILSSLKLGDLIVVCNARRLNVLDASSRVCAGELRGGKGTSGVQVLNLGLTKDNVDVAVLGLVNVRGRDDEQDLSDRKTFK